MILVDTGVWLALANRRDADHEVAARVVAAVREPLVTTWPVLTETCHMLLTRLGTQAERALLLNAARGTFRVMAIEDADVARLAELVETYRDLPMDLADASLVLAAERFGTGRILSTDRRDFRTYRWKRRRPFTNLMPER